VWLYYASVLEGHVHVVKDIPKEHISMRQFDLGWSKHD
jgi:hypothetical protein